MEFIEFKKEILNNIKRKDGYTNEYQKVYDSKNFKDICGVITNNFDWACRYNIITGDLLEAVGNKELNKWNIAVNKNVYKGFLYVYGDVSVRAYNTIVYMYDTSKVNAFGYSIVETYNKSVLNAFDNTTVKAYDYSKINAHSNTKIVAFDDTTINAFDNTKIYAYGFSKINAFDTAIVKANRFSKINAFDNTEINVNSNSIVNVYNNAEVTKF